MKIRKEQMEVFQRAADLRFQHWLVTYLRKRHPRAVENMPDDLLEQRVAAGISRAKAYGVTQGAAMVTFVSLMFVISPDFDRRPAMQDVLTDRSVAPDERVNLLFERVSGPEWTQASQNRNLKMWDTLINQQAASNN